MMRWRASSFRPFAPRARRTIMAIFLTFALVIVGERGALDLVDRHGRRTTRP